MPGMQAMVEAANAALNLNNIAAVAPSATATGQNLGTACQTMGVATTPEQISFLNTCPVGLQHTLLAAIDSARSRGLPVQLSWTEGPYRLTIYEAAGTAKSLGAMAIGLESPMPS